MKDLARSLYARQTISNNYDNLILIVTTTSQKFCQLNIADTTTICTPVKQFAMAVIDEHLMLKVNKSLNQRMGLVERGTVMHLTVFIPIKFCPSDPTDLNVIILESNFQKIAQIKCG
jgi:hypothetical protein